MEKMIKEMGSDFSSLNRYTSGFIAFGIHKRPRFYDYEFSGMGTTPVEAVFSLYESWKKLTGK